MMKLQVIHHLFDVEGTNTIICRAWGIPAIAVIAGLVTRGAPFTRFGTDGSKPLELYTIGNRLPLQIIHRVNRGYFDPPFTSLEGFPDEARVVPWDHNELVAILDIGIGERYLRGFFGSGTWGLYLETLPVILLSGLNQLLSLGT